MTCLSGWRQGCPLQPGCCRSDLARECRRAPIPDVGQLLGRLSAVPRNLTFGGGGTHSRVSDSATWPANDRSH